MPQVHRIATQDDNDRTKTGKPIFRAHVVALEEGRVWLAAGQTQGVLGLADDKLDLVAAQLDVGDVLRVFIAADGPHGVVFSTQGLARAVDEDPDPWVAIGHEYGVGDVVRGRVSDIRARFILVELLPGAACLCHISELASEFVEHPGDVVQHGERVSVEILHLDILAKRGNVSLRRAGFAVPRPAISAGPGLPLFLPDDSFLGDGTTGSGDAVLADLESANADRVRLREQLKATKHELVGLRKELRAKIARIESMEIRHRGVADPLGSESDFLAAVRVEYARRQGECERFDFPLCRMRLHPGFLASAKVLEGVPIEKIIEVCAQVACLRAHWFAAREVHELGDPALTRARDGAKAWRCALQLHTSGARRLHWWDVPAGDALSGTTRVIEFTRVGLHDDYSMPE